MDVKKAYAMIPLEQYDLLRKENKKLQAELDKAQKVHEEQIYWLQNQIQMLKIELERCGVHRI